MSSVFSTPVKFPASVVAIAPITLSKAGGTYTFGFDTSAGLGGAVWVWQLRTALGFAGNFWPVDTAFSADPSSFQFNRWHGGGRSSYGDQLSNAIQAVIGLSATQAAYAAAAVITP
jgi:hypothetical protein